MIKVELEDVKLSISKFMENKNKPLTDPQRQDLSPGEGEDVASKVAPTVPKTKEEQQVEDEIQEAINKLKEEEKTEEKTEEEKTEEGKTEDQFKNLSVEEINALTGRTFKDKEDFFKHYKNLAAFTGVPSDEIQTLRDKAKAHDQMLEDAKKVEELLGGQKDDKKDNKKKETVDIEEEIKKKVSPLDEEVNKIKQELEDAKFLRSHPDAEQYLDTIKAMAAKEDKSLVEVFEGSQLETLIEDSKSLKDVKDKEKDLGVQSKARLTLSKNQKIDDLVRDLKLAESGGKRRDVDEIKQKLVEAKLNIALEEQKDLF